MGFPDFKDTRIWFHDDRLHVVHYLLVLIYFFQSAHRLIEQYDIKWNNIINIDQVTRFFETEPKSIFAAKWSREVPTKNVGTSHKRFTATFAITAELKFLKPHILSEGLTNKPTVHKYVLDVNKTGMCNDDTLLYFTKDVAMAGMESVFLEPFRYIMDSYGVHIKLASSKLLEYKIFIIIPPNLTNILHSLDAAINRSFPPHAFIPRT